MRFRRLVGFLSGICVLSLTLGQVKATCENARAHLQSAAAGAMAAHGAIDHQAPAPSQPQKSCTPSKFDCCKAMTSCGLSVSVKSAVAEREILVLVETRHRAAAEFPINVVSGPETPPPKF
jgi:hypothetical protein